MIAHDLTGNPSVILIDEFSTGIDAKMKRDMWAVLRTVAVGKAVVITTRSDTSFCLNKLLFTSFSSLDSMEEASALASKVGIISGKMLGKCLDAWLLGLRWLTPNKLWDLSMP